MTKHDKHNKQDIKNEIIEEVENELEQIDDGELETLGENVEGGNSPISEIAMLKDALARTTADLENFKKRTIRDRDDMIFFLKFDIFKKIIPRLDDLERIIKNTPEEMKSGALFEGILSIEKAFKKDLNSLGVEQFDSIGEEVDPNKHDVMTQVPGEAGIIVDQFEKGYMLGDKVLRHAKVVVGAGK